jgi:hypothetical protein
MSANGTAANVALGSGGAIMVAGLLVSLFLSAGLGVLLAWVGIALGLSGLTFGWVARRVAQ